MMFEDRRDAGRRLAERLDFLRGENVVVLGVPPGGAVVASEVASSLRAPLDVVVLRRLDDPQRPGLTFGALSEGGVVVIDNSIVSRARLTRYEIAEVERHECQQLTARVDRLRRAVPRIPVRDRIAVVVDEGIAVEAVTRAVCREARARGARRVILAVPAAGQDVLMALRGDVDELVCVEMSPGSGAGDRLYRQFAQVTDAEVTVLLNRAAGMSAAGPPRPPLRDESVHILAGGVQLAGHLMIPSDPIGLVVFAHGSGSSRHSPRNRYVAGVLNDAGLGTLLVDLLTAEEEGDRSRVFDVQLLASRLVDLTVWLAEQEEAAGLRVGYFGASTGAAAALRAVVSPEASIAAVVSRGGRPDLAGPVLAEVQAPTMLIVGGADDAVLELNRLAAQQMTCETVLTVVPGATHLFTEPGALTKVAELARTWFIKQLAPLGTGPRSADGGKFPR
ncbi:phosphoribosyltransferase [Nocardia cyriacigeorgica]|uniref:Phosphoribosyltransferase n=1 Tax=Nocardia cyriacigeorgica TaxID=135487 RepID=A0A6P1D2U0_9NOCA|nr:phosphoribosyltransferase family protein [Nocardia cyriacigeorgica]NEW43283.1 phosphoribosyltransferase [Nocardia cyriacigeorgica]NEW55023.1 phosphoribosyltransferase [Nocardia cyriacigeorgica]